MTKETENTSATPVEPVLTPLQQEPPEPASTPPAQPAPVVKPTAGPAEEMVPLARFTGAIQKVDQLTMKVKDLETNILSKNSEIEQLKLGLQTKGQETDIVVGERENLISSQNAELVALRQEAKELRAFRQKVEMAKELGRPELINALHIIPTMESKEALRSVMSDVLSFRDEGALQRERELTSGVLPHTPQLGDVDEKPSTHDGWQRRVDAFPIGSPERKKALDEMGEWIFNS